MGRTTVYSEPRIRTAARIYHTNNDAALALGITGSAFSRLCKKYGIETPHVRRQREKREATRSFV